MVGVGKEESQVTELRKRLIRSYGKDYIKGYKEIWITKDEYKRLKSKRIISEKVKPEQIEISLKIMTGTFKWSL